METLGYACWDKITVSSIGARKSFAESGRVIKVNEPRSENLAPASERIATRAPAIKPNDVD